MDPHPIARRRVGNLIVVFEIPDEAPGIERPRVGASPLLLPRVELTLVEKSPLGRGDELLRTAKVIRIIRLVMVRQSDHRGVMKVIIPHPIQTVAVSSELRGYAVGRRLQIVLRRLKTGLRTALSHHLRFL